MDLYGGVTVPGSCCIFGWLCVLVSLTCAHRTKCYYFVAVSQMDGDNFVPVTVLASFNQVCVCVCV